MKILILLGVLCFTGCDFLNSPIALNTNEMAVFTYESNGYVCNNIKRYGHGTVALSDCVDAKGNKVESIENASNVISRRK